MKRWLPLLALGLFLLAILIVQFIPADDAGPSTPVERSVEDAAVSGR